MDSNAHIIEYWEKQPDVLKEIVDNAAERTRDFVGLFQKTNPTGIYLIGSGTSLNAEEAAAPYMREMLDIEVSVMPSSCIGKIQGERPLIVFLSQGGSSTNTLKAMEQLKDCPFITVTGEEKCEIASRSTYHMTIGCGVENVGPKTLGYTCSVMILYMMATETARACGKISGEEYRNIRSDMYVGLENMRFNMESAKKWVKDNRADMSEIENYLFIGRGVTALALKEGCLKVLETIKKPALSYEFEEYLHGPILFMNERVGGFLFISGEGEEKERFEKLAACQKKYSRNTYIITTDEKIKGTKVLHIRQTGKSYTEVFETVVVPQLVSVSVQEYLGIEDGAEIYDEYTAVCPTKYNNGR